MSEPGPSVYESVCSMFERQADQTPDAIAVVCEGRSLTYRELEQRISQLARHLRHRHGVGAESIVGLLLGRSERMLVSMLAVLKAGGAYLPISPDYPPDRIAYVLGDAAPSLVITEERYAALVTGLSKPHLSWDDNPVPWSSEFETRLSGDPGQSQLAYVMYTSGSTGIPKGVMAEHGNLSNFIDWCRSEYRESVFDVVYAGTPYGFDLSNIELYFPLATGRRIRLLPSSQVIGLYLRRDHKVLVNTVPSLVQEMVKTEGILERVTVLNLGGEAVPPALVRALGKYPNLEIRNMYGPTETTSTAINARLDPTSSNEVLIGTPIANTVVYVLDEEQHQVRVGIKGEICIGGRGLSRGYWNRPELTRERFVPDPFRPGERMYRTGDLGVVLPDGNLKFLGRNDNQVKLHGFRIELDEVGHQLALHPDVAEAVVGIKNQGNGARLIAIVRGARGDPSAEQLAAFLRRRLPPYMIPDDFVIIETFPLTPTGKIDRRALFGQVA